MVHTHMRFLFNVSPYVPFFCYYFYLFGPLPPQVLHLLPIPNMEWAVHGLCVVLALGTPKMTRVR